MSTLQTIVVALLCSFRASSDGTHWTAREASGGGQGSDDMPPSPHVLDSLCADRLSPLADLLRLQTLQGNAKAF